MMKVIDCMYVWVIMMKVIDCMYVWVIITKVIDCMYVWVIMIKVIDCIYVWVIIMKVIDCMYVWVIIISPVSEGSGDVMVLRRSRPPPAARNGVNAITQKPRDGLFSNLVYTLVMIVSWPD